MVNEWSQLLAKKYHPSFAKYGTQFDCLTPDKVTAIILYRGKLKDLENSIQDALVCQKVLTYNAHQSLHLWSIQGILFLEINKDSVGFIIQILKAFQTLYTIPIFTFDEIIKDTMKHNHVILDYIEPAFMRYFTFKGLNIELNPDPVITGTRYDVGNYVYVRFHDSLLTDSHIIAHKDRFDILYAHFMYTIELDLTQVVITNSEDNVRFPKKHFHAPFIKIDLSHLFDNDGTAECY